MNNEIKEILFIEEQNADYKRLSIDELITLEDYITNLQKENKKLSKEIKKIKKEDDEIRDKNSFLVNGFHKLEERIDKAIKYLKGNEHTCNYVDIYNYTLREEDVLNILQGSDNKWLKYLEL